MEKESKRYDMVNLLRLICAYFVVAIHTVAFSTFGDGVRAFMSDFVFRIAVPFFFITSGYFLYSKYEVKGYFKKYIIKLIIIFAIVTLVNSIIMIPMFYSDYAAMNIGLLTKEFLVNGVHGSLWYFPALIISSAFVYIFIKKGAMKSLSIISIILFIVAVLGDSWYGLIKNTPFVSVINGYEYFFNTTRNGITFGVPFLTLGVLINKYNVNEKVKKTLVLNIVAWMIYGIESYLIMHSQIAKDYNIYFSLALVGSALFIAALNSKITLNKKLSSYFREMSLWIYGLHGFLIFVCYLLNMFKEGTSQIVVYIVVCIISTIVSYIISFFTLRKKI